MEGDAVHQSASGGIAPRIILVKVVSREAAKISLIRKRENAARDDHYLKELFNHYGFDAIALYEVFVYALSVFMASKPDTPSNNSSSVAL